MRSIITALVAIALIVGVGIRVHRSRHIRNAADPRPVQPAAPSFLGDKQPIIYLIPSNGPTLCADNVLVPDQFADLRLPTGRGPFPVVVVLHSGCWAEYADVTYTANLATALTREGWATWNVEYRRVHQEGGGLARYVSRRRTQHRCTPPRREEVSARPGARDRDRPLRRRPARPVGRGAWALAAG
jgi:hypothetical protein